MSKTPKIKPLTKEQTILLRKKYYQEKNYFGRDKLYNLIKFEPGHPTKEQVGEWLKTQEIHQLHLKQKRSTTLKPIVLKKPDSLYEIDVVDMGEYADGDNRYILTMIDVFSRFAYAAIMKNKDEKSVLKAFKSIVKEVPQITRLQSDNGSEFTNATFKNYLKAEDIKQNLTVPGKPQTNGVIERFNGTLKGMIQKDFSATLNKEWSSKLQTLVDNYNNSFHDTIKMSPTEARINTSKAFENVKTKAEKHVGRKYLDIVVGDQVRLKIFKGKLEKHSTKNWSMDLYTIDKIVQPKQPYNSTTYRIKGDPHVYSRNDIQLIKAVKKPPKDVRELKEDEYEIESILQKKKRYGKIEFLVKWRGYEDPQDLTWESFDNIKSTAAYATFLKKSQANI